MLILWRLIFGDRVVHVEAIEFDVLEMKRSIHEYSGTITKGEVLIITASSIRRDKFQHLALTEVAADNRFLSNVETFFKLKVLLSLLPTRGTKKKKEKNVWRFTKKLRSLCRHVFTVWTNGSENDVLTFFFINKFSHCLAIKAMLERSKICFVHNQWLFAQLIDFHQQPSALRRLELEILSNYKYSMSLIELLGALIASSPYHLCSDSRLYPAWKFSKKVSWTLNSSSS